MLGTSVEGDAGIAGAQLVDRQGDGRFTEFREHDLAGAGRGIAGQQHAGLLTLQQQHRRQQGRLDVVKRLADDAARQPGAVRSALEHGVAAATILPSKPPERTHDQLRIAFDGDAVIFGDESERVSRLSGLAAFHDNETSRVGEALSGGPFKGFLAALHKLQEAFPAGEASPIRTALVTARSAPAHERVILTLREWGVRLDEAMFLGGRDKGPFLETFGADIFFDDSRHNVENARRHVATGQHVVERLVDRLAHADLASHLPVPPQ